MLKNEIRIGAKFKIKGNINDVELTIKPHRYGKSSSFEIPAEWEQITDWEILNEIDDKEIISEIK